MNCSPIRGGVPVLSCAVHFCVRFSGWLKKKPTFTPLRERHLEFDALSLAQGLMDTEQDQFKCKN